MDAVEDTAQPTALVGMPRVFPPENPKIVTRLVSSRLGPAQTQATSYRTAEGEIYMNVGPADTGTDMGTDTGTEASGRETEDANTRGSNYRKVHKRSRDFKNKDAVVVYVKQEKGKPVVYTRCASAFTTLKNTNPLFTTSQDGLVHVHASVDEFFDFVVHRSGQGARNWGPALNLANQDHLDTLLNSGSHVGVKIPRCEWNREI